MATVRTDDTHYAAIAAAIRGKNGTADTYTPARMAEAVAALETGSPVATATVRIQNRGASGCTVFLSRLVDGTVIPVRTTVAARQQTQFADVPYPTYVYTTLAVSAITGGTAIAETAGDKGTLSQITAETAAITVS